MRHGNRRERWRPALVAAAAVVAVVALVGATMLAWPRLTTLMRPSAASATPSGLAATSVFVLGDEQTGCTSQSGCGPDTFIAQAAEDLGWNVRFLDGRGYLDSTEPYSAQSLLVAAYQPDLIVLSGGLGDRARPAADVREAVATTVADLQAAAPAAEVIVLGPVWESSRAVPADVARTAEAIVAGADAAGAVLVLDPVGEGWFGRPASGEPSDQPSGQPSGRPSGQPSGQPSDRPSGQSSGEPSGRPSGEPSGRPSGRPSSSRAGTGSGTADGGTGTSTIVTGVLSPEAHRTVAAQLVTRVPAALAAATTGSGTSLVTPDATPTASGGTTGTGSGSGDASGLGTPGPEPCVPVVAIRRTLLPDPGEVTVDVVNSGGPPGLAADVAGLLAERGFVIDEIADDGSGAEVTAAAEIRFGPRGRPAARLLKAYVPGAVLVPDDRRGRSVELAVTGAVEGLTDQADVDAFLDRSIVVRPCPRTG